MTLTDAPFTDAGVPVTEGAGSVPWPLVALVHLQAGILILDATGKVVFVNEWFLKRCGMAADALVGHQLTEVFDSPATASFARRLALSQKTGFPAMLSHSLHAPPLPLYMPHLVGHASAILSQSVHIIPMGKWTAQRHDQAYTLVQVTDVTPTVRRESLLRTRADEMELMARVDALTGIGNRRAFSESLDTEVRAAMRTGTPLGLLMMDIDYFKPYNDHYGHPAGDQCLREVAAMLQRVVRRPRDRLARYGGEEFVVLLPGTPVDGVLEVGREVIEQMRKLRLPHLARQGGDIVTLSVGAASIVPKHIDEGGTLLRKADDALYEAKAAGRDRLCYAPTVKTDPSVV
jgi:diguanylate cyclase (GGDEF)-like protein